MPDKSASNYSVGSGDSMVNLPSSAYYPVQGTPMDVEQHPVKNFPPMQRIKNAFQAMEDGDMDKPSRGMNDSGR